MKKLRMIHDGNVFEDGPCCRMGADLYDDYLDVMNRCGYGLKSVDKVAYRFIPGTWVVMKSEWGLIGACAAAFGVKDIKTFASAHIDGLAVLPEYRGEGFGTQLVNAVVFQTYKAGYQHIYVDVHKDNPAAIRVYEKAGFRRI